MLVLLPPEIIPANSGDLFLVCCWLEFCICGNHGPILSFSAIVVWIRDVSVRRTQTDTDITGSRQVDVKNYFSMYSVCVGCCLFWFSYP